MKIALCISGEMRDFQDPLINNSIRQIAENLNCDIFISTWSHNGVSYNKINDAILKKRDDLNSDLENRIMLAYGPRTKSIEIENYNEWLDNLDPSIIELMSTKLQGGEAVTSPPQLYKIYKCNQLKLEYQEINKFEYEVCIRVRPDLIFLSTPDLSNSLKLEMVNHINFGIEGAYWPMRIYDIFFYSKNDIMDKISNSWLSIIEDSVEPLPNGLDRRDACSLLKKNAIKYGIEVNDLQNRICSVYRGEGYEEFMRVLKIHNKET